MFAHFLLKLSKSDNQVYKTVPLACPCIWTVKNVKLAEMCFERTSKTPESFANIYFDQCLVGSSRIPIDVLWNSARMWRVKNQLVFHFQPV